MHQTHAIQYSVKSVLGWLILAFAVLLGLGAIPTTLLGGLQAFQSQLYIGSIVLVIMIANAITMKGFASRGPQRFAFAFMVSGSLRVVLCTGLIILAQRVWEFHRITTLIWTCGFYLGLLSVECACIAKALNRDAFRAALGEFSPRRTVPQKQSETHERKQTVADRQRQPD